MAEEEPDEPYANIRELIGNVIGKRILDVTQHEREEFEETEISHVTLMLEDGSILRFNLTCSDCNIEYDSGQEDGEEVIAGI